MDECITPPEPLRAAAAELPRPATLGRIGATAKLSDIKVGMFLVAEGTQNSDGSLTATAVRAGGLGRRGFDHGPNGYDGGANPNATAAPSATSSAG